MPSPRLLVLVELGLVLSCSRPTQDTPKQDVPEMALRRHVSRESGEPESSVDVECTYNPEVSHGSQAHRCRATAHGTVGLYVCDCPLTVGCVWPFEHPGVTPCREPERCACWQVCCTDTVDGDSGAHACFPCQRSTGCVIDAECATRWPAGIGWVESDPRKR